MADLSGEHELGAHAAGLDAGEDRRFRDVERLVAREGVDQTDEFFEAHRRERERRARGGPGDGRVRGADAPLYDY